MLAEFENFEFDGAETLLRVDGKLDVGIRSTAGVLQ